MAFESLDEADKAFKALEDRLNALESENTKLKASKQGLQSDLKKRKAVDSFLKVAGIELNADMTEDEIAEKIVALRSASGDGDGESSGDGGQPPLPPASTSQQPPQGQPPAPQYTNPSEAVDAVVKAEMASLKRRLEEQNKRIQQAEQERDRERESRRAALLEQKVLEELARVECRKPTHLFKLKREDFRLLEDEETVVYGPEDDPISLKDAVSKLREDDDYTIYFNGSGATGSGMTPSRTPAYTSANNPFAVGSANATLIAEMINNGQKEKAGRLMREARAAGKLDPTIARGMSSLLG